MTFTQQDTPAAQPQTPAWDVLIIGAGIVGAAVARELAQYQLRVLTVEKEHDVACGATRANSGILHAGFDCEPGSVKAALNLEGLRLYAGLVQTLDIPYRNNGALVLCLGPQDEGKLRALYEKGVKNRVPRLRLLTGAEARALEPNLSESVSAALLAETAGVISPYEAALALAENACQNGVTFLFDTEVTRVAQGPGGFLLTTGRGCFSARTVVNAAGIFSDHLHNQVAPTPRGLYTQRGQYYLLDSAQGAFVERTVFQLPTPLGKGVLITSTVDRNLLIGPNAENDCPRDDRATTRQGLAEVLAKARLSAPRLPIGDTITQFAGIRAKTPGEDFILEEPVPGFVDALGIDSPGLSAAPAIGQKIAAMVLNRLQPALKPDFIPRRQAPPRFKTLSLAGQAALIAQDPRYGHVVCRCETVTEGEIVAAIQGPLGARTLDGLKRRTRVRMGRCQGGFCTLRLVDILSRELGVHPREITLAGKGSNFIL
jgi:glycerol-3-phosphate dehydrogenase